MTELIRTADAQPTIEGAAEYHPGVSISTDANGDGSTTVSWDEDFNDGDVAVQVTGTEAGDWHASTSGASQATINVLGAAAGTTVTCHVTAFGNR